MHIYTNTAMGRADTCSCLCFACILKTSLNMNAKGRVHLLQFLLVQLLSSSHTIKIFCFDTQLWYNSCAIAFLTWTFFCSRPKGCQTRRRHAPGYCLLRFLADFHEAATLCKYLSGWFPEEKTKIEKDMSYCHYYCNNIQTRSS